MNSPLLKRILAIIFILMISSSFTYLASVWTTGFRWDMTEYKLYTLTDATRGIIKDIKTPIRFRLYYSKVAVRKSQEQMRRFNSHARYVQNVLEEFARLSPEKIKIEVIDPRPDSDDERDALRYELKRYQLTQDESFFFGMVILTETGLVKTIPIFAPERQQFVEYDITKLVVETQQHEKPTLGILSSLNVMGEDVTPMVAQMMRQQGKAPAKAWILKSVLEESYTLKRINTPEDIAGVDCLMIVHLKNADDDMLFAIDQHVMRNKNLLVFEDPFCSVDPASNAQAQPGVPPESPSSNLNRLLEKWGVSMNEQRYAGDLSLARVVGQGSQTRHLAILDMNDDCVNDESIISAKLSKLMMVLPGILTPTHGDDIKGSPILTTTESGGNYYCTTRDINNPALLQKRFQAEHKKIILGYQLRGIFSSAFDKPPVIQKDSGEKKPEIPMAKIEETPHIKKGTKKTSILVFSDVDILTDEFAFSRSIFGVSYANQNIAMLQNALEVLTNSSNLIEVRSRGEFRRPFKRVEKMEEEAEKQTGERTQAIADKILRYRREQQALTKGGDTENLVNLSNDLYRKRRTIKKEIEGLEEEQRELKKSKRQRIEALGFKMQMVNMFFVPVLLTLYSLWVMCMRTMRTRLRMRASHEG